MLNFPMGISKELRCVRRKFRIICEVISAFLGIAVFSVSVFAYQFGIDHDQKWGSQRIILASTGILFLLLSAYSHYFLPIKDFQKKLSEKPFFKYFIQLIENIKSTAFSRFYEPSTVFRKPTTSTRNNDTGSTRAGWWAIAGSGITILIALWFLTNGTFITWPANSNYFDRLANAFLKGRFSLLEHPPAELLALPNPYDWRAREGMNYIWDASLFEGKYYLYFGPVPALLAMIVKWFYQITIDDQFILFFFYIGFVISMAMILNWVRTTFFPKAPGWTVFILTTLTGLCVPVLWLTKNHNVYETSILGGQFFLVLGLYAVLRGLQIEDRKKAWFCLGGFMWGASVGCRMVNTAGIALMSILTGIILLKENNKKFLSKIIWLILPLALWAVCLGYYNYGRFGNFFETGHRLQLTGPAYASDFQVIFSTKYIIPNIYNIFVRPPKFSSADFPFVFAPFIKESMWPWYIHLPGKYYYSEPITGLFFSVPVFCLFFTTMIKAANEFIKWLNGNAVPKLDHSKLPVYRVWGIVCIGLVGSILSITLFIASTMRYLVDIAPLFIICLAFYVWWGLERLRNRPLERKSYLCIFLFLSLGSIFLSILINLDNDWFKVNNPTLYSAILNLLSGRKR